MTADMHSPSPEELMAYLDGELTGSGARDIPAHLAVCAACQRIAADVKNVSGEMRHWQIDEPPATLSAPRGRVLAAPVAPRRRLVLPKRWQLASAAVAVIAVTVAVWSLGTARKSPPPAVAEGPELFSQARAGTPGPSPPSRVAGRSLAQAEPTVGGRATGPAIVRTAELRIVSADFDGARQTVERILREAGGFVGDITVSENRTSRSLTAVLRIPADRLGAAIASLRQIGRVTHESENAEDVTEQVIDLNARLTNARTTEKRLAEVLRNRTGRLTDILEVEREMSRVRTEIERLDAERINMERRVSHAMLRLEVVEDRGPAVDLGPVSIDVQIRHALADGFESAISTVVDAVLFLLRAGPSLLLWGVLLGLPAWFFVRRWRRLHDAGAQP